MGAPEIYITIVMKRNPADNDTLVKAFFDNAAAARWVGDNSTQYAHYYLTALLIDDAIEFLERQEDEITSCRIELEIPENADVEYLTEQLIERLFASLRQPGVAFGRKAYDGKIARNLEELVEPEIFGTTDFRTDRAS